MNAAARPIGVLALQGGYAAHERALAGIGRRSRQVREARDLEGLDGLVLPGGESSAMLKLIAWNRLWQPLDDFVRAGRPVLATCAGLILAAKGVSHPAQESFGWLDVDVARNAWGRQNESFEAKDDSGRLRCVFIRAPRLTRVGPEVEVIARLEGEPIAVRAGSIIGASFHPELADETGLHEAIFGASGAGVVWHGAAEAAGGPRAGVRPS
jgi:5'-phosphate synthase pdxT subunit